MTPYLHAAPALVCAAAAYTLWEIAREDVRAGATLRALGWSVPTAIAASLAGAAISLWPVLAAILRAAGVGLR